MFELKCCPVGICCCSCSICFYRYYFGVFSCFLNLCFRQIRFLFMPILNLNLLGQIFLKVMASPNSMKIEIQGIGRFLAGARCFVRFDDIV